MENVHGFDQRAQIISELLQGLEFAKQLQNQMSNKNNNDHNQAIKYISLLEKMMSTFDKTITIAKQIHPLNPNNNNKNNNVHLEVANSLAITTSSPTSENSQPDNRATKRRKMMPRWTKTVQIGPDKLVNGLEGPLNDGLSWRKYGQKGIFGARFPRGYYRCTHRHSKGCFATKQVQQCDEDPSIYKVMYRGDHTCYTGPNIQQAQTQLQAQSIPILPHKPNPPKSPQPIQEIFVGLSPEGDLKIEPNENENKAQIFRCFSFKSNLQEDELLDHNNYMLSYSPDFASPTTSDSTYFSASPYQFTGPSVGLRVQTSESDLNDSNSGQNSVNNSPMTIGDDDFEFSFDPLLELDPYF